MQTSTSSIDPLLRISPTYSYPARGRDPICYHPLALQRHAMHAGPGEDHGQRPQARPGHPPAVVVSVVDLPDELGLQANGQGALRVRQQRVAAPVHGMLSQECVERQDETVFPLERNATA